MPIKFDVKMTRGCVFQFLLFHTYTRPIGLLGLGFGFINLILGIRSTMLSSFSSSLMSFVFAVVFLGLAPFMLWVSAGRQMTENPMFNKTITYEMDEEGITVYLDEVKKIPWNGILKGLWNRTLVCLYVTQNRAILIPREAFVEQDAEVISVLDRHVKNFLAPRSKKEAPIVKAPETVVAPETVEAPEAVEPEETVENTETGNDGNL